MHPRWTVCPALPTACAHSCPSGLGVHLGTQSTLRSKNQGRVQAQEVAQEVVFPQAQEVVSGPFGKGIVGSQVPEPWSGMTQLKSWMGTAFQPCRFLVLGEECRRRGARVGPVK